MGNITENTTYTTNITDDSYNDTVEDADDDTLCDSLEYQTNVFTDHHTDLLVAVLIIIILSLLTKRKNVCRNRCGGYGGTTIPINFLENKYNRIAFMAAFVNIAAAQLGDLMGDSKTNKGDGLFTLTPDATHYEKVLYKLGKVYVISLKYFPIFACCTSDTITTLTIGIFYTALIVGIQCMKVIPVCSLSKYDTDDVAEVYLKNILNVVSGLAIILHSLLRIYEIIRSRKYHRQEDIVQVTKSQLRYVKNMLQPKSSSVRSQNALEKKMKKIYKIIPGFQFSLSILSGIVVGMVVVHVFAIDKLAWAISELHGIDYMEYEASDHEESDISSIVNPILLFIGKHFFKSKKYEEFAVKTLHISWISLANTQLRIFYGSGVIALLVTLIVTWITVLNLLATYREDMQHVYRNTSTTLLPLSVCQKSNTALVVSACQYAGFQTAYIIYGFFIQAFILFVLCMLIGELVIFPLILGLSRYVIGILEYVGPIVIVIIVTMLVQRLLVKYFFLEDNGATMALTNRRAFFNMMYFLFFYNMLRGLISCLIRMLKSIVFGSIILSRLDKSVFPRTFERFDSAYKSYVCLLHLECLQGNPIVITFIHILSKQYDSTKYDWSASEDNAPKPCKLGRLCCCPDICGSKPESRAGDYMLSSTPAYIIRTATEGIHIDDRRRKNVARTRWFLAYTLIKNADILLKERWHAMAKINVGMI